MFDFTTLSIYSYRQIVWCIWRLSSGQYIVYFIWLKQKTAWTLNSHTGSKLPPKIKMLKTDFTHTWQRLFAFTTTTDNQGMFVFFFYFWDKEAQGYIFCSRNRKWNIIRHVKFLLMLPMCASKHIQQDILGKGAISQVYFHFQFIRKRQTINTLQSHCLRWALM